MIKTNDFQISGILTRKDIIEGVSAKGKEYIMISLVLQVGENKQATLNMFANKKSANGEISKLYQNAMTIKDEYKCLSATYTDKTHNKDAKPVNIESCQVATLDECDFIRGKGVKLEMNRYFKDGQLNENFRLSCNFVSRAKEGEPREGDAVGELIGVVTSVTEHEDTDGKPYGIVNLNVPTYREAWNDRPESIQIEKFKLMLRDDMAIEYCVNNMQPNDVVNIVVEPLNMVTKVEAEEPERTSGFGRVYKKEPVTKVVKELLATGGGLIDPSLYEEDKNFDPDLYNEGLKDFENKINELKQDKVETRTIKRGFGNINSSSDLPF